MCPGQETSMQYFSCSGGLGKDSTKSVPGHVTQTFCFSSSGICGTHSAFWCIWDAKHQHTIFDARWDRYGFHKKRVGTRYVELVFLNLVGPAGHVVHSVASGA